MSTQNVITEDGYNFTTVVGGAVPIEVIVGATFLSPQIVTYLQDTIETYQETVTTVTEQRNQAEGFLIDIAELSEQLEEDAYVAITKAELIEASANEVAESLGTVQEVLDSVTTLGTQVQTTATATETLLDSATALVVNVQELIDASQESNINDWITGTLYSAGSYWLHPVSKDRFKVLNEYTAGATYIEDIATGLVTLDRSTRAGGAPVLSEIGLSLLDQGRSPAYNKPELGGGLNFRKYDQKGVMNWLKRWTKNGFTYLQTAGKSGDTNEGSLERVIADVMGQTVIPDVVNIWLGGNDINALTNYSEAEAELATMISDFEALFNILTSNNIEVMVSVLPNNGLWSKNFYAMWVQSEWMQYLIEFGRKRRVKALLNFGPQLADPEAVWTEEGVVLERSGNIVSVLLEGHGYNTGDRVNVFGAVDTSFENNLQPVGFLVTKVNNSIYTYENVGPDASTTADVIKLDVLQFTVSDGSTHFRPRGACKGAHIALPIFLSLFPPRDILSSSENDYRNLIGVGKPTAQFRPNMGMMYGSGGDKLGTPLPTGDVVRSHEVKIVNGNPLSVTCSIEQDDSIAFSQYKWQRLDIVAGSDDCEVVFQIKHSKPAAFSPEAVLNAGTFIIPSVQNGYFYVNINDTGETGDIEPVWPTRIGETVVSGDCTLQCRLGYIEGVTKMYAAAAYKIPAMDTGAIHCISFGIFDETTGGDSILDFNNNQDIYAPGHFSGEEGHFCTPEAVIRDSGSDFSIATKIRVAAGKSASVMIARETWRVVQ